MFYRYCYLKDYVDCKIIPNLNPVPYKMNERLVSRETVVQRQWESERLTFGIKQVDKGQIPP